MGVVRAAEGVAHAAVQGNVSVAAMPAARVSRGVERFQANHALVRDVRYRLLVASLLIATRGLARAAAEATVDAPVALRCALVS